MLLTACHTVHQQSEFDFITSPVSSCKQVLGTAVCRHFCLTRFVATDRIQLAFCVFI